MLMEVIGTVGRIVGLVSCLMCAVPFLIIASGKDSMEPINFWSGDTTLKSKVKNIAEYNGKMAVLYRKCAIAWLISGISWLILPLLGIIMTCLDCTLGIYLMYLSYKKILGQSV